MNAGPYSIGSGHWPGLAKAAEECGELQQVIGKIIATNGGDSHWDGTNLRERLEDEIGDVWAALTLVITKNRLSPVRISRQQEAKYELFLRWHDEHRDGSLNRDGMS